MSMRRGCYIGVATLGGEILAMWEGGGGRHGGVATFGAIFDDLQAFFAESGKGRVGEKYGE
jgi:hypothetical protein